MLVLIAANAFDEQLKISFELCSRNVVFLINLLNVGSLMNKLEEVVLSERFLIGVVQEMLKED